MRFLSSECVLFCGEEKEAGPVNYDEDGDDDDDDRRLRHHFSFR